ncbi:ROK family transcriptional regulator [Jannaschia sp. CCS1]|uniref:ROK family transcriptional regulator n=1 Tax=Jannaschia sp. (strain CCS1) TaxID=290400 RepID=UPI000053CBD5|nr:ROK family transcriptional regulator [Jannaschia sp. CCS1]ABD53797.1 ROK [Jannaschia sp. CCS1]
MIGSRSLSRQFSRSAVVQAIASAGPISRASLAKQVGLSKQTVSEIVSGLESDGWIIETGRTAGHVGRSATTYELVPDAAFVCGVDLGGTKVRAAIIDLTCTVVAELTEPTDPQGGTDLVQQIGQLCRNAALQACVDWSRVMFATIGVPGVPDQKSGSVKMAPNIDKIGDMDFAGALEAEFGFGVQVENDVNLAAIGEQWSGCASEVDNMAFVSLGTGIGAGIIVGGQIIRGAMGAAGELGFLPFGADPFEPSSLRAGALERQAGSFGMIGRYSELAGKDVQVKELFDLAQAGDEHADIVLEETARLVARLIATIGAVVDPSMVVLGGSIGQRRELQERIEVALADCFPNPIDIRRSALGNHAALVGGAAVGLAHLHHTIFAAGLNNVEIALPQLSAPAWRGVA